MKWFVAFLAFALALPPLSAGDAGATQRKLAGDAYPRLADLAVRLIVEKWSPRADELIARAPLKSPAGANWAKGDPHWEAAKQKLLSHVEQWATGLAKADEAKALVEGRFASAMTGSQADAIAKTLATDAGREFGNYCDTINVMVEFAGLHSELKIGSKEFQREYAAFVERRRIPSAAATPAEVAAIMKTPEGRAYADARNFSLNALVSGIDGQINLRIFDAQEQLGREIGDEAAACAKEHK